MNENSEERAGVGVSSVAWDNVEHVASVGHTYVLGPCVWELRCQRGTGEIANWSTQREGNLRADVFHLRFKLSHQ